MLWCWLLIALPLQGLAGIVDHLRGAAHVHTAATVEPPALPPGIPMLLDATGWRHSHGGARGPAIDAGAHHHTAPERHDHAEGDATVVAQDVPDSDNAPASRAKRLLIDLDTPPVFALASGVAGAPVRASTGLGLGAEDPVRSRLERPPRP